MEFNLNNKIITVFCNETQSNVLPVVILNTYDNEGASVWQKCSELFCNEFILVSVANMNWNDDLTPWECPPLYKGDSQYLGNADDYLHEITGSIIPKAEEYITQTLKKEISYYAIAGYSLGGLFALYAGFRTDLFKRIASASGSLWYPEFAEYVDHNTFSSNVDKVYLSLGNKESKSRIKLLATVEERTKQIYQSIFRNVNAVYEENEGNHFKDADFRMAKGIKRILE